MTTHSFSCVNEEDDAIRDPDAGRDLVREVHVTFERGARFLITFYFLTPMSYIILIACFLHGIVSVSYQSDNIGPIPGVSMMLKR